MKFKLNKMIYVLGYLYENNQQKVFKGKIVTDLQITYVHIHGIIKRLYEKGYLITKTDGERKKPIYVELTDEGQYIGMLCKKLIDTGIADE